MTTRECVHLVTSPETKMIVLTVTEDRTIVSSFIWTKHRNVTDRQTDIWCS